MSTPQLPDILFRRVDESADETFYSEPRFVAHIDQVTIDSLTEYYRDFLPAGSAVLDLMSSWISHLPGEIEYARVAGLGMNAAELAANPRLDDYLVHNLNTEPEMPYADASFDRITIVVSIQYLIRPVEVLTSARRLLRPGGAVCIAMSHRLFPTKAILAFHELPPTQRIELVSGFLAQAGFDNVQFVDRSPPSADPLWLVTATR